MKIPLDFFQQDTVQVATLLLGKVLLRQLSCGSVLKGMIVETEAYLGLQDPSCHSFGGRKTHRTQVMYRAGGCAYVYFTYGMHYCFNIVTAGEGEPEAVLIRAVQPLEGVSKMQIYRYRGVNQSSQSGLVGSSGSVLGAATGLSLKTQSKRHAVKEGRRKEDPRQGESLKYLTNGPAKLCQAFQIGKECNGASLLGDSLYIEEGPRVLDQDMGVSERVGLSLQSSACYWPLRFYIKDHPCVSVVRR